MKWSNTITDFSNYLLLERGMAQNTLDAYQFDLQKLASYFQGQNLNPLQLSTTHLQQFISEWGQMGFSARSQARLVSTIRAFYKFLLLEDLLTQNPAEILESPTIGKKLPEFLTFEEIEKILNHIDLGSKHGHRNLAIFETLYGCGLRVSELIELRLSDLFFKESIIRVSGKGNKQRYVPINNHAQKQIDIYHQQIRVHLTPAKGFEDHLFLNNRGTCLTRSMIFHLVKTHSAAAGISKTVSPHTFRHSFATHLVEGGADLRSVQMLLGHESITTTEIYTHLDASYLRDVLLDFHPRAR